MNEKSDKDEVAGTNRNADDIERQLAGTQTHSLNLKSGMSPELQRWTEELFFYEQAFPKYDEHGRVLVATLDEILQTVAQWYVRKNNKYYDVDVPGEVLSRDDVERVIIHRLLSLIHISEPTRPY